MNLGGKKRFWNRKKFLLQTYNVGEIKSTAGSSRNEKALLCVTPLNM